MPAGYINKNTVLVFNTYESMRAYIPSGQNRIGVDNSTGNYYIYNNSRWVLFRENVPFSSAGTWWPIIYPPTASYVYTGSASQSMDVKNTLLYNSQTAIGNYTSVIQLDSITQSVNCATGSAWSLNLETIAADISTSLR